ncbi:MAG: hypothetical protein ABI550_01980 [Ignavibacteriaceae bacterium]
MKLNWFKKIGIFYIPTSVIGGMILFVAIAYSVYLFIEIDSHSHSVSDTLINFVFKLLIIGVVYFVIGVITSGKESEKN